MAARNSAPMWDLANDELHESLSILGQRNLLFE